MRSGSILFLPLAGGLLLSGCQHIGEEFQKNKLTLDKPIIHERLEQMAVNAMQNNMTVGDRDFVSHTSTLNEHGKRRLDHYMEFLRAYGGSLHFEPGSAELDEARMAAVSNYLGLKGLNHSQYALSLGISKGRGMGATEAIELKEKAFAPEQERLTQILSGTFGVE